MSSSHDSIDMGLCNVAIIFWCVLSFRNVPRSANISVKNCKSVAYREQTLLIFALALSKQLLVVSPRLKVESLKHETHCSFIGCQCQRNSFLQILIWFPLTDLRFLHRLLLFWNTLLRLISQELCPIHLTLSPFSQLLSPF